MSEANARFLDTIPELYDRHLGPVVFEPYAADLVFSLSDCAVASLPPSDWSPLT
ncbi:MAG: hypothetical protein QOH96_2491 [Blastocatellia bacterium]|nr:hypothetical protein [Blastocatellia bacterium]